jgi:hypothetical protein
VAEAIVLFRQQTLLPLDDCLYALRLGNPALSRTTLHRYFRKRGLSSLAAIDPIHTGHDLAVAEMGYVHVGFMKIHVSTGEVALLNGFERVSKFAFGLIEGRVCAMSAGAFVHKLVDQVPFQIRTIQTSDDWLFVETDHFSRACRERGIVHRVIATSHSDRGTGDRSARIALEGPAYDFETIQELQSLLAKSVDDYNRSCRLKSLGGLTPSEYVAQRCKQPLRPSAGASLLPG